MSFPSWFGDLRSWLASCAAPNAGRRRKRRVTTQLHVEKLEDRCVPSAAGSLDTSFGVGGIVTTNFDSSSASAATHATLQADGKIVVVGYSRRAGTDDDDFALARYDAVDGSLDTTFGVGGKVTTNFGSPYFAATIEWALSVAVQADGKIVAAGYSDQGTPSLTGHSDFALARYNVDGSLDTSFGVGGKVVTDFGFPNSSVNGVALQCDGKIVAAGISISGDANDPANWDIALARYNVDGSLDTSFGVGGKLTTNFGSTPFGSMTGDAAWSLALQADHKIVVAGSSNQGSGGFALARYNEDGSLDTSFGVGGKVVSGSGGDVAFSVALQPDGRIVAAGHSNPGATLNDFALSRYNADGSLDTGFGVDGIVTTDFGVSQDIAEGVAVEADGRIVAAGYSYQGATGNDFVLAQYNADGSLDTSFGMGGKVVTDFGGPDDVANGVVVQGDGNIVVVGTTNQSGHYEFALARYLGNTAVVAPTVSVTAANATYTGVPYDAANLTTAINPATAGGSVSYVFYSDAAGQSPIATPVNAGRYYVQAFFTSCTSAFTDAQSAIVSFNITAKELTVDATTQGTINIARAGTISFALQVTDGLVGSNNDVAALFSGATFTITVGDTSYSVTSTATVASDGTINLSIRMTQGLQNALVTALSEGNTVDFGLSALSTDGDYSVAADAISRLINRGKLKFAVL